MRRRSHHKYESEDSACRSKDMLSFGAPPSSSSATELDDWRLDLREVSASNFFHSAVRENQGKKTRIGGLLECAGEQ